MKYVMLKLKTGPGIQLLPIMFPNQLVHSEVAKAISSLFPEEMKPVAVRAGDCTVNVTCSGKSETLGLFSEYDDSSIINTHDYVHGLISEER